MLRLVWFEPPPFRELRNVLHRYERLEAYLLGSAHGTRHTLYTHTVHIRRIFFTFEFQLMLILCWGRIVNVCASNQNHLNLTYGVKFNKITHLKKYTREKIKFGTSQ